MRMHNARGRAHAAPAVALDVAGHMPRACGCRPRPSLPRSSPRGLPRPAGTRPDDVHHDGLENGEVRADEELAGRGIVDAARGLQAQQAVSEKQEV